MEERKQEDTVPRQEEGAEKDIAHEVVADDAASAKKIFETASSRLLDVNRWHQCSGAPARFQLTDADGNPVFRPAEKGNLLRIDIPGPGPAGGDGYDWVRIEAIESVSSPDGIRESIAMRVRPAANPKGEVENVAHFFNDHSTSSFMVERVNNKVTAAVHGRNEVPNTKTSNLADKVRNVIVAATAIAGLSNVQWKKLVKGFLS